VPGIDRMIKVINNTRRMILYF